MKYIIAALVFLIGCEGFRPKVQFSKIPEPGVEVPVDETTPIDETLPEEVIEEIKEVFSGSRNFEHLGQVGFITFNDGAVGVVNQHFNFRSVITENGLEIGQDVKYLGNNFFVKRGGDRYTEYLVDATNPDKFVLTIRIYKGKLRTGKIGELIYEESFNEI